MTSSYKIVDTNVPIIANLSVDPDNIPDDLIGCVYECVKAINQVLKDGCIVLDSKDEIYNEYRKKLSMSGQPGLGDAFLKWVYDRRCQFPDNCRVKITKEGTSYKEFPEHENLTDFDSDDRKFVAVANAHPDKPPILEATDSKWWGWKDALEEVGIKVEFLCPEYVENKYNEKMGVR